MITGMSALRSACLRGDDPFAESLRARGADEVGVERVEHRRARHAREKGDRAHAERERGQHEKTQAAVAGRRQPVQRDGEKQDEQQPDPVHRKRDSQVREPEREAIDETAGVTRAEHAQRDADDRGEQHRGAGELQRLRKAFANVLRDRTVRDVRAAEVSGDDAAHVVREPLGQRIVEVELRRGGARSSRCRRARRPSTRPDRRARRRAAGTRRRARRTASAPRAASARRMKRVIGSRLAIDRHVESSAGR